MIATKPMRVADALIEARRRWGNNGNLRDCGPSAATTPESRAAARRALQELRGFITWENKANFQPYLNKLFTETTSKRYQVGEFVTGHHFNHFRVYGTGDTWEDAFADNITWSKP